MRIPPLLPLLAVLLAPSLPLRAQEAPITQDVVVRPFPSHSFGRVLHGKKLTHVFWLLNRGTDTVTVSHIRSSCGCTAAMVENTRIAPGDSSDLTVTYYPPRPSHGPQTKSVAIFLNDESRPRFQVGISADIISEMEPDSSKRILGPLATGATITVPVRLRNTGSRAMELLDVQSTLTIEHRDPSGAPSMLTIDGVVVEPKQCTFEAGEERTVMVTFTPHETGRLMGSMVFIATDENREVEFTGDIQPGL